MQEIKLVKNLAFGDGARSQILTGVEKLTNAVGSTLGASGKCVILEDANGMPQITKDGVTVANAVTLQDSLENIGATLIKQAAQRTVSDAGDRTTTATVLAKAILDEAYKHSELDTSREIKEGINSGAKKINDYLKENALEIKGDMLQSVSAISCNNDLALGKIISEAYEKVGKDNKNIQDKLLFVNLKNFFLIVSQNIG